MPTRADRVFKRFPQLADFTPDQRSVVLRRCAHQANRKHAVVSTLVVLGAVIPGLCFGWLCGFVAALAVGLALGNFGRLWPIVFLPTFVIACVGFVVLLTSAYQNSLIRREIRRELGMGGCLVCGYSLLGLPIEPKGAGVVRCPECGARMRLVASDGSAIIARRAQATKSEPVADAAPRAAT